MSWGIVASVGATVVSGAMQSNASKKAANAQAAAAGDASAAQYAMYEQNRSDLAPYRNTGKKANNALEYYLGLGNPQGYDKYGDFLVDTSGGAPRAVSDLYQNDDNYKRVWDQLLSEHVQTHGQGYIDGSDTGWIDQVLRERLGGPSYENPYGSDNFGSLMKNFTGEDLQNEPGYQFGLSEGQKGLDRRLATGGNYFSGAALKAASRYNQDYAGTKFGEAFNRDASNKNRIYGFLSGTAGAGQNAASQTGTAGANAANAAGNYATQGANANAAGIVGGANGFANGLGGAVNAYQWNQLLAKNNTPQANWTTPGYGVNGAYSDY